MKTVNAVALLSLLFCEGCNPVIVALGGTAIAGAASVRNKEGISGSISDTKLQTKINGIIFKEAPDLFDRIELSVKHGRVIVIGYFDDDSQCEKVKQIVDDMEEIKEVFYEIAIQKPPTASDLASDSSITSRIKSALFFDGNVSSLNYDITTVKGIVYICGTAASKYERDVVINAARTTSGVNKVIAYVELPKKKKHKS
ncbi:MAG: BON domain-containing protein [Holosporaceae bacterium]|jgi:osmotically-inducible protein OsmY|nr:BON domain-containing protein [Holosporaceae bacterium]